MPGIPIGFVEVWQKFTLAGDPQPMWTSLGYEIDTPPFTNANAIELMTAFQGSIQPVVSHNYVLAGGQVKVGSDGGDILFEVGLSAAGGNSDEACPNNCAMLVTKSTGSGGRRNRGRMFIPGPSRNQIEPGGGMSSAYRTAWQTAVAALQTLSGTVDNLGQPVLFHQTAPFTPTPIVGLVVQQRIATQRRRMR